MKLNHLGPNMIEVDAGDYVILFSYSTPVAYRKNVDGYLYRTDEFFSVTTSKHINKWLNGATATKVPQAQIEELLP